MQVAQDVHWVELRTAEDVLLPAQAVIEHADRLKALVPGGNLNLEVEALRFERGADLLDLVRELRTELQSGEAAQ